MRSPSPLGGPSPSSVAALADRLTRIETSLAKVCDLCPDDPLGSSPVSGLAQKMDRMENVLIRLSSVIKNVHIDFQTAQAASNPVMAIGHATDTIRDLVADAERIRSSQEAALEMARALQAAMPSLAQEARYICGDESGEALPAPFRPIAPNPHSALAQALGLSDHIRGADVMSSMPQTQADRDAMEDAMAFLSALA